jgi:hypothetical protein
MATPITEGSCFLVNQGLEGVKGMFLINFAVRIPDESKEGEHVYLSGGSQEVLGGSL